MLRFRQQLMAAPPPPPPAAAAPVINLDTATGHMTDITADAITENLRAWYEMLAANDAKDMDVLPKIFVQVSFLSIVIGK